MLARRHAIAIAIVCPLAVASACMLTGCQPSSQSTGVARNIDGSSFNVSLAAVSEATFSNQHQFYYYPSAQVYRDCDQDRWLWSEDGGATWVSAARLPAEFLVRDEIPFAVHLTQDSPALEHQAIAAAFPAPTAGHLPVTAAVQGRAEVE
jgi:hypothetical protein